MKTRESCVLCACKHIAQARALMLEYRKGYPEHYFFALGHLAEAEDELVKDHPGLASECRDQRLLLEADDQYPYQWGDMVLRVANFGQEEVERVIVAIESEYQELNDAEIREAWFGLQ